MICSDYSFSVHTILLVNSPIGLHEPIGLHKPIDSTGKEPVRCSISCTNESKSISLSVPRFLSHATSCAESFVAIPNPLILKLGTCRGNAAYSELDLQGLFKCRFLLTLIPPILIIPSNLIKHGRTNHTCHSLQDPQGRRPATAAGSLQRDAAKGNKGW